MIMRSGLHRFAVRFLVSVVLIFTAACNSSTKDLIDVADGVDRKPINSSLLGTNAFANDSRFGSPSAQFAEIKNVLRLNYVRLLFAWNDGSQGAPGSSRSFGFYDDLIDALPAGVDALIVVTGAPSWMQNPANWVDGNPRKTFVQEWVSPVAQRYGSSGKVIGFQIWNEPNNPSFTENSVIELTTSPANYVELLALAHNAVKEAAPGKLVLNAATTAINQNYPETLDYNRAMRDAGVLSFVDRYAIHYYGKQFENVVRDNGVRDYLNGLSKGIWVTESGAQGVNSQLAYGEQTWPFLLENIPGIERIYQYQFAEASDPSVSYGLRNLSSDLPVSDLYVWLANR